MATKDKTNKNYKNSLSTPYKEGKRVASARNELDDLYSMNPVYLNSYARQLKDIYSRIKDSKGFEYSPENDSAYRRFADEYNLLSGAAVADNLKQAQQLSGGYTSSFAPEVAYEGLMRLKENASAAQPEFLMNAQNAFIANEDLYKNIYSAAANARNDELGEYINQSNAFNNQLQRALKRYADFRDMDYSKYSDNRNYFAQRNKSETENSNYEKELELKKYDVYEEIAQYKCAEFKDKADNSGMKKYLDKMVSEGKLTRFMADNLYLKYKYTAPAGRSYSRSGSKSSSSSKKSSKKGDDKFDPMADFIPNKNILKFVNLRNRDDDFNTAVKWLDYLVKQKRISKTDKLYYEYYYRDALK